MTAAILQTSTNTSARFLLQITFKSDWHVGTGSGRPGSVDRLLARDAEDLPFVPAKTLTGIWRDGCEKVAAALDTKLEAKRWSDWVDYLFGDQPSLQEPGVPAKRRPRMAAPRVGHARYGEQLRTTLARIDSGSRARLRSAMTYIRPGIKIDPKSGTTLDRHLRFVEMGRAGSVLVADCELVNSFLNEDQRDDALALLVAGAALVERLGGKRRRGSGRCVIMFPESLPPDDPLVLPGFHKAIKRLASTTPTEPPEILRAGGIRRTYNQAPRTPNAWICVSLKLTLIDPVVVAKQVVGNVVESFDFIPGTMLLAPLASVLESILGDQDDQAVNQAIVGGELQVLPATVEVDRRPGRPIPLALFRHKHEGGFQKNGTVVNRLVEDEPESTPIKGFREGYLGSTSPWSTLYPTCRNLETVLKTHNTIDDREQRPTAEVGGVFSYEAIPPGTVMRSELRISQSLADRLKVRNQRWWETLEVTIRAGRSRKDDYGRVEIRTKLLKPETMGPRLNLLKGDHLVVWLLSDALVRRDSLRFEPSGIALKQELERFWPGVQLAESRLHASGLSAAIGSRRIESWQVSWGMPRPTLLALRAGSCAVFRVASGTLSPKHLAAAEAFGIGERRAEGYGRVHFNDPLLTSPLTQWQAPPDPILDEQSASIHGIREDNQIDHEYAMLIEKEAWRHQIRITALRIADDKEKRDSLLGLSAARHGKLGMAQLQALRGRLIHARGDMKTVEAWIRDLAQRKERSVLWPAKVLDHWLSLIADARSEPNQDGEHRELPNHKIWEILREVEDIWPWLTDHGAERLRGELRVEAIQTVFDACLRAHHRAQEG